MKSTISHGLGLEYNIVVVNLLYPVEALRLQTSPKTEEVSLLCLCVCHSLVTSTDYVRLAISSASVWLTVSQPLKVLTAHTFQVYI